MNPDQPNYPQTEQPVHNPLAAMQPGEKVICEVKRHPIGIVGIYVAAGLLLITLAILAFIWAPSVITSQSRSQVMGLTGLLFLFCTVFILAFVYISNIIYWGNRWILTDDSITQIAQTGLFTKRSSQLSLGNLEDVAADKKGIFAQIFNYGTLRAETAGERSKFKLAYTPKPEIYAQQVLEAREKFEQRGHASHAIPPVPENLTPSA